MHLPLSLSPAAPSIAGVNLLPNLTLGIGLRLGLGLGHGPRAPGPVLGQGQELWDRGQLLIFEPSSHDGYERICICEARPKG